MNFLAHIYLSGDHDFIKIGNFIADGVRGKNYTQFNPEIQTGIKMHRAIDTFTDAHPIFKQSTKRLHHDYSHYSGVVVDIFYDHFLAKNWSLYSDMKLADFVSDFYSLLGTNLHLTTDRARDIYPTMTKQNWLLSYQSFEGISEILYQMDQRTKFKSKMQYSSKNLELDYAIFEQEFFYFFTEIQTFAATFLETNHKRIL